LILQLDTSALVPLLVDEPTTAACQRLWNDADLVATARLTFVKATAALAQACRHGRLSDDELVDLRRELADYRLESDVIEIDDELIRRSADAAVRYRLRGYDAVHCSAADRVADAELVAAAGDQQLLAAWRELGIAVADTTIVPPESRPA
jgi:predicted nucleic acid-binding protein